MLRRRVIPCLDVANGRVVKGTRFVDLVDEGDPPELAERYAQEGADELVFLDISAAPEGRGTLLDIVERTARRAFVPLTVGGGVRSVDEMRDVLRAGADKVGLNTRAVADPPLVTALRGTVRQPGGRRRDRRPAGRSADATLPVRLRGRRQGRPRAGRPRRDRVGGAGGGARRGRAARDLDRPRRHEVRLRHRAPARDHERASACRSSPRAARRAPRTWSRRSVDGGADAVLAASIFHRREVSIGDVKLALAAAGIPVRLSTGTEVPA